jgi:hypothetical protein
VLSLRKQIGPDSNPRLHFERFNFTDESLVAGVSEKRTVHVELKKGKWQTNMASWQHFVQSAVP